MHQSAPLMRVLHRLRAKSRKCKSQSSFRVSCVRGSAEPSRVLEAVIGFRRQSLYHQNVTAATVREQLRFGGAGQIIAHSFRTQRMRTCSRADVKLWHRRIAEAALRRGGPTRTGRGMVGQSRIAECGLVLLKAKAPQPPADVHVSLTWEHDDLGQRACPDTRYAHPVTRQRSRHCIMSCYFETINCLKTPSSFCYFAVTALMDQIVILGDLEERRSPGAAPGRDRAA
jgi:hypothetical protein